MELARKNAQISLEEKFALIERDEERTIKAVESLGSHLHIETPHRIEAFDNSNIQGADPVSAMVVFIDGKPNKKEYRKYKVRDVKGRMIMRPCGRSFEEDIRGFLRESPSSGSYCSGRRERADDSGS